MSNNVQKKSLEYYIKLYIELQGYEGFNIYCQKLQETYSCSFGNTCHYSKSKNYVICLHFYLMIYPHTAEHLCKNG